MRHTELLSPEAQEEFGNALESVFNGILKRSHEEREQTEPWKNLFTASEQGLRGILSEANSQMVRVTIDTTDIIQKKFGIRCSNKLHGLIKALPFVMNKLGDAIHDEQGLSCCSDKARQVYYDEVLAEIKHLLKEQRKNKEIQP